MEGESPVTLELKERHVKVDFEMPDEQDDNIDEP